MLKYLIILLVVIAAALIGMYRLGSSTNVYRQEQVAILHPHYFNQPRQSIETIEIKAFYVVPKNKTDRAIPDWQKIIEESLQKLAAFHRVQLRGLSSLIFQVYPKIVIGREENSVYDTEVTEHGNPAALRTIGKELEERVFARSGDLYRENFSAAKPNTYQVLYIIYEGVGASGSENIAILSRAFLTDPQYALRGQTYLVHEFYHTLGLPDAYDIPSAVPAKDDLMGSGRERPLGQTYISHEYIKGFGL